jgi:hypothetical protein
MAVTQIDGGRQIKAATITNAEIAAGAAIALSKLAEAVIQADGGQAFTANQSMGSNKLTSLDDGTDPGDAVNLSQLEAAVAAIASGSAKNVVRLATTANITLSGTQTIDGVAGSADDRIFVKDQTAPEENGLYLMKAGAWVRTTDADTWNELVGALVPIAEGTVNHDTLWLVTADQGGTLDTTAVTSVQLPGPSDVIAGAGLTRTGQTLDFVTADTSLTVGANNVAVNPGEGIEISTGVRVKLDGGTLARSGSGLKVADAGITATQIAAAVAGDGLSGGAGSALSVNTDDSTIEKSSDALRVKDAGITAAKLGSGARRIVRETPSGTVNGSNDTFTLANTPASGKEEVFLNGLLQEPGGEDYTITTNSIVFVAPPLTGDRLRVSYMF